MSIKAVSSVAAPHSSPRLSPSQLRQVDALKSRDQHVRLHQPAATGPAAGKITLDYRFGPDGRLYVIAEQVQFDAPDASTARQPDGEAPQAARGGSIDTFA